MKGEINIMGKVVVYSKANCGQCTFTKKELDKLGVSYEEKRIDLNPEFRDEAIAKGAMGAPFVVPPVGEPFSGFQPAKLAKLAVQLIIAYYSITGNVKRFVDKLSLPSVEIDPANPFLSIDEPFIVVAPTYERDLTEPINDFIENNDLSNFKGVMGSGNLNFADLYVFTAKDIAKEYNVPLLYSFEYSGTNEDIEKINTILGDIK